MWPNGAASVEAEDRQIDRQTSRCTGEYSYPLSSILASSVDPLLVTTVKKPRVHIQVKLSDAHTPHTQKCFVASSSSSSSITFHQTCLKFQARTCQDNNVRANRLMSARTAAACEWNLSSTRFSPRPLLHCQFTYAYTLLSAQKVRQIKRYYTLYILKLNKERIY